MRADARKNYDLLIDVAREVFVEQGAEASLRDIARRAGVGMGTLYRHFPNRDSLLEAFTTLAGRGSPGNALQFDNFRAITGFLRDVVTGDFSAQHVIRRNVAHNFAFRCLTVQSDHRNFRLVCHLHGVAYGIRIRWVDQQDFGATNG